MLSIGQCSYIYSPTSTNGHLSTTVTFFVPTDNPYIYSCLNLSTTVTSLQRQRLLSVALTANKHLDNSQYSQLLMKKSRMVIKFDSYGTLMVRGIGILIVLLPGTQAINSLCVNRQAVLPPFWRTCSGAPCPQDKAVRRFLHH